jgi:5-methylthioadenosine/S-adenosylhomocysteine deaminase
VTLPRSQRHLLVRGGTLVTMDRERRVLAADVLVTDGRIAAVGVDLPHPPATRLLDAGGLHVLPGFIQGHVHLGQSLFRGLAEDRELLPWLAERILPLEAAHTEESAYRAGMLGAADALLSGTTTVQDIGVVKGAQGIFRAVLDSGIRGTVGKCLMDAGSGVPPSLIEETAPALAEAAALAGQWAGEGRGRIRGAICPRFLLSSTRGLWEGAVAAARSLGAPLHTHLLESEREDREIRERWGKGQLEILDEFGALDVPLSIAHGVLFGEEHRRVLGDRTLGVVHCPSANAKLGSGTADLVFMRSVDSVHVGIGCDGPPCNNDLDVLEEMRLAALLQGLRHGPGKFSAQAALELATVEGARAVGMEGEIGCLAPGMAGDLVVLDLDRPQTFDPGGAAVYDRIVYGAGRDAVRWVVVDGEVLVENGRFPHLDSGEILARAREEAGLLLERAALP